MNGNFGTSAVFIDANAEFSTSCNCGITTVIITACTCGTRETSQTGTSTTLSTSNWGNLHGQQNSLDRETQPLRHDRDFDDLHDLHNRASTTLSTSNWGTATVTRTTGISLCVTKGVDELQLRNFRRFLHINVHNWRRRPPDNELQLGNLDDLLNSLDHWDQRLHHEREVDGKR